MVTKHHQPSLIIIKNSDSHNKNINGDETNTASKNMPNLHRLDAEPHDALPNAKQKAYSRELLLDRSSIMRASTKIERAAPHIYGRIRQADGPSVTDALKISYKHVDCLNAVYMYKRKDMVYDIQRGVEISPGGTGFGSNNRLGGAARTPAGLVLLISPDLSLFQLVSTPSLP